MTPVIFFLFVLFISLNLVHSYYGDTPEATHMPTATTNHPTASTYRPSFKPSQLPTSQPTKIPTPEPSNHVSSATAFSGGLLTSSQEVIVIGVSSAVGFLLVAFFAYRIVLSRSRAPKPFVDEPKPSTYSSPLLTA